jgi:hypothetical protein
MRFARNLVGVTSRERMRNEDMRKQQKMERIDEDVKRSGCNV